MKPFLLVLSSPSGGGKTTIARSLLDGRDELGYSVSATTRPLRGGEVDGRDYHFLTRDEFQRRIDAGAFVEWAEYGGNLYGTLWSEVEMLFSANRIPVLDIDIQGAQQIRAAMPEAVLVFVMPPSAAILADRLKQRNTEAGERIRQRLDVAALEVEAIPAYDYVVENDNLVGAVSMVASIIDAELHRTSRQPDLAAQIERFQRDVRDEARRI
ncbi:MAG TPA: guanylate kinase [Gemmatimonadales bacterium]|nr:guanylate kinase [Gemmatimonadales bacterium]